MWLRHSQSGVTLDEFTFCVCTDISLGQSGMPADIGGVLELGT